MKVSCGGTVQTQFANEAIFNAQKAAAKSASHGTGSGSGGTNSSNSQNKTPLLPGIKKAKTDTNKPIDTAASTGDGFCNFFQTNSCTRKNCRFLHELRPKVEDTITDE